MPRGSEAQVLREAADRQVLDEVRIIAEYVPGGPDDGSAGGENEDRRVPEFKDQMQRASVAK